MQLALGLCVFSNGCDNTSVIKLFSVDQNKDCLYYRHCLRLTENQGERLTDGADKASSASPISTTVMMYRLGIVLEVNRFMPCERSVDADRLAYL